MYRTFPHPPLLTSDLAVDDLNGKNKAASYEDYVILYLDLNNISFSFFCKKKMV